MKFARCLVLLSLLLVWTGCKMTFSGLMMEKKYFAACKANESSEKDLISVQSKQLRTSLGDTLVATFQLKAFTHKELKEIMGSDLPPALKNKFTLIQISSKLKDAQYSFVMSLEEKLGKQALYSRKVLSRLMNLNFLLEKSKDKKLLAGVGRLENTIRSYLNPSGSECNLKNAKYCNWFVLLSPAAGQSLETLKLRLTWFLEGGGDLCYVSEDFVLKVPKGKSTPARINAVLAGKNVSLQALRTLSKP